MMLCSCHGLHGWVPVAPSPTSKVRGRFSKGFATAGLHLDLRRDELPRDVFAKRRLQRCGMKFLETIDHAKRGRIEQRKLLFDSQREVAAGLELLISQAQLLVGSERLRVSHATTVARRTTLFRA